MSDFTHTSNAMQSLKRCSKQMGYLGMTGVYAHNNNLCNHEPFRVIWRNNNNGSPIYDDIIDSILCCIRGIKHLFKHKLLPNIKFIFSSMETMVSFVVIIGILLCTWIFGTIFLRLSTTNNIIQESNDITNLFIINDVNTTNNNNNNENNNIVDDVYNDINDDINNIETNNDRLNTWVVINTVNWNTIHIGQSIILIDEHNPDKIKYANIQNINLDTKKFKIQYYDCNFFCTKWISIESNQEIKFNSNINNNINNNDITQLIQEKDKIKYEHIQQIILKQKEDFKKHEESINDKIDKMAEMFQAATLQMSNYTQYNQYYNNNNIGFNESKLNENIKNTVRAEISKVKEDIVDEFRDEIYSTRDNNNILRDDISSSSSSSSMFPYSIESVVVDIDHHGKTDWCNNIIKHSKRYTNDILTPFAYMITTKLLNKYDQNAILSTYNPGDCIPLYQPKQITKYNIPFINIELYSHVYIQQISLFHFRSEIMPPFALKAIPHKFTIYGSKNNIDWYKLGNFTYNSNSDLTQYYSISTNNNILTKYISFRSISNHGSPYTCVYRIRVYAEKP